MDSKRLFYLLKKNFLFYLSRKINYPLVAPDAVQINFTFRCNLRCKMCGMHEQMNFLQTAGKQVEIDSFVFRKIIRETKDLGTDTVLFIGGEPLLRSDIFDLVSYAKSFSLNTILVTNGVLLGEDNIRRCFDSGVDWLSISIDAASEEIFSKIRGENVLGTVINNINTLNNMKKNAGKEFPRIVSVCTIMNDNLEDLLNVVRLCRESGIERVLFQPVVANNIDQTERESAFSGFVSPRRYNLLDESIDQLIDYKEESSRNFDFIGNSVNNLKLIKKYFRNGLKSLEQPCYAGYNRLQIVQEGKIYFCVNQKKHKANFGDIKKDPLRKLWYSPEARFYRKLIKGCESHCLQWCSYRDEFIELFGVLEKNSFFSNKCRPVDDKTRK